MQFLTQLGHGRFVCLAQGVKLSCVSRTLFAKSSLLRLLAGDCDFDGGLLGLLFESTVRLRSRVEGEKNEGDTKILKKKRKKEENQKKLPHNPPQLQKNTPKR